MMICNTCLSKGRTLFPLNKFEELIKETKILKIENMTGYMCWECRRLMEKFVIFKRQVHIAQYQLKTAQKIENLTSLSRLYCESKYYLDAEYHYSLDPLTNSEEDTKKDINIVKQEDLSNAIDEQDDKSDLDYEDEKPELTDDLTPSTIPQVPTSLDTEVAQSQHIYVETLEKSPKKVKKKKFTSKKADEEEVMKKFTTIVYSEEEMLKKREEKRSQPNFKKIPYKCDLCVLGFTRKETYDEHLEKKHDESIGPLKCDVCHVRFATDKSVSRHRRQHYISYQCKLCKYTTSQLWSALNHCRTKHEADSTDRVHCTQCVVVARYLSVVLVIENSDRQHYISYQCKLCKYTTSQLWSALNHCRTKHEADSTDRVHCTQCEVVARTPEELADHIKTNHVLFCNECGEQFKGKNTLRTHKIRIHGVKRQFICDICSKSFKSRSRLESHMSRHSTALASRLAYCASCRVQYKNIYVYRNHLRNSANHAETHVHPVTQGSSHNQVFKMTEMCFICDEVLEEGLENISKLFISDWRLKNHKQKHHGLSRSRDHACNVCGKKFYTLSTLRGHQLTHSEQRSYMCEDCGDTFKQRPALYTHARLVHRAKKT